MIEVLCWSLAKQRYERIELISRPRLRVGILPSFLNTSVHRSWQVSKSRTTRAKIKRKLVPSSEVSAIKDCKCHESFAWSCVLSISQIQSFVVALFWMHQTDWISRHEFKTPCERCLRPRSRIVCTWEGIWVMLPWAEVVGADGGS